MALRAIYFQAIILRDPVHNIDHFAENNLQGLSFNFHNWKESYFPPGKYWHDYSMSSPAANWRPLHHASAVRGEQKPW